MISPELRTEDEFGIKDYIPPRGEIQRLPIK